MDGHDVQKTLLGWILATFACTAGCQTLPAAPQSAPPAAHTPDSATLHQAAVPVAGWGSPAQQEKLSGSRGGTAMVSNDATLGASVTRNTATNVTTGSNIIEGGSFASMSGIPMVIQNSGANVLIQNATVINLQMR